MHVDKDVLHEQKGLRIALHVFVSCEEKSVGAHLPFPWNFAYHIMCLKAGEGGRMHAATYFI